MADGHGMTVGQVLARVATFPSHGEPQVKVGDRWYPRSTSDDVPEIVRAAANEVAASLDGLKLDSESAYPAMVERALAEVLRLVWPDRRGSDTMHKDAAHYVVDWATANGIVGIEMPEAVNKFAV